MKPWQEAKRWQEANSDVPFEQLLGVYLKEAYCWSSPEEFVLARLVQWHEGEMYDGDVEPNCWFVQLAAGENPFKRFLKLAPKRMQYVAWQRHGNDRYHVWEWNKFKRKVYTDGIN